MTEVTGGCFCGAVRFRFGEKAFQVRMCWCRDCQYLASGNASVNAIFRSETFTVTGEMQEYLSTADSGTAMRRRFCPRCGTQLFSEAFSRPEIVVVRAGTLDDPEVGRPSAAIWTSSAPSWVHFDDDIPKIEGQPAPLRAPE
jgi:hypothetical protein